MNTRVIEIPWVCEKCGKSVAGFESHRCRKKPQAEGETIASLRTRLEKAEVHLDEAVELCGEALGALNLQPAILWKGNKSVQRGIEELLAKAQQFKEEKG